MAGDLTRMIDALVEQKTFSLDAVGSIKDLRDRAVGLETDLTEATGKIKLASAENQRLNGIISTRDEDLNKWRARETALMAREAKMTDLEKQVAVEMAKSGAIHSCFDKIFANRMVRESVTRSVPTVITPTYQGGMPQTTYNTENTNVEREER